MSRSISLTSDASKSVVIAASQVQVACRDVNEYKRKFQTESVFIQIIRTITMWSEELSSLC